MRPGNIRSSRWIIRSSSAPLRRGRVRSPDEPSSLTPANCPACPTGNAPNLLGKSFSITADVEIPPKGAEGMLNTLGGRFGGYGLYLLKGKPVFTYNLLGLERFRWEGSQALTPGKHTIVFDFKYDGPAWPKAARASCRWTARKSPRKPSRTLFRLVLTIDESFDVGVDTRTWVDDNDYQPPFRFTGKLDKLTIKLEPNRRGRRGRGPHQEANASSQKRGPVNRRENSRRQATR